MSITSRSYNHDTDFPIVCDLIAETFFAKPTYQLWIPSRFENSIFYDEQRSQHVHLWWDEESLVGVAIIDPPNNIVYITHPEYRHLIAQIIQWAELALIADSNEGEMDLYTYALKDDKYSISILESLGYFFFNECEHPQLREIIDPLPQSVLSEEFSIKQIEPNEYDQFVKAIETVFHHNKFTQDVFEEMRKAKFYKEDLLIGVFTSDGTLVAFAQQRIDNYKIIEFEPVGTLPNYRRKGLAKAIMRESFIRAEKYEPKIFYVGGAPTEEADHLYSSVGFTKMRIVTRWSKKLSK